MEAFFVVGIFEVRFETEDGAEFGIKEDNAIEFDIRTGLAIARITVFIENYKRS